MWWFTKNDQKWWVSAAVPICQRLYVSALLVGFRIVGMSPSKEKQKENQICEIASVGRITEYICMNWIQTPIPGSLVLDLDNNNGSCRYPRHVLHGGKHHFMIVANLQWSSLQQGASFSNSPKPWKWRDQKSMQFIHVYTSSKLDENQETTYFELFYIYVGQYVQGTTR